MYQRRRRSIAMTLSWFVCVLLLEGVCALSPCPLGPKQQESFADVAVAVTPSQTNTCGEDFMISMDRENREPSVVLLSFGSSVSSFSKPAVLEVFARADSSDFRPQNITVYGFTSVLDDVENVSWNSSGGILKPFDPSENWMDTGGCWRQGWEDGGSSCRNNKLRRWYGFTD